MSAEWATKPLGSVGIRLLDCLHKTPDEDPSGTYRYVAIPQMIDGRLEIADARPISEAAFLEWTKKADPQAHDVILSRRCNPGETAYVAPGERFAVGQNLVILRADGEFVFPPFLRWLVRSPAWWLQVRKYLNVGAVFDSLKCRDVPQFRVPIPPLDEQRSIAALLGALDDKIEQNRRTARVLESLARATFQAWFLDFEPVRAKAAGSAAFPSMPQPVFDAMPSRFVDSEMGPVPEGWRVSTVGELAKHVAMGPFGSDIKTDNFVAQGVPVIRGGNLRDGFVDSNFVYLTETKADQLANANAFANDVVITHRGTLGQVGLIPAGPRHRRYVVSQSQMLIRPDQEDLPPHFLYLFLTSRVGQHELLANRSQTGVPAISRPTTSVKAIRLVVPGKVVSKRFESIVSTMFDCRTAIADENRKLAEMRDYLLPKLLSGSVRAGVAHD